MKTFGIFILGGLLFITTAATAEIEEIVVTAQKRTESVQDVPISITAFSGDELDVRGLNDMQDVARYVPNFQMPTGNISRNTSLRIRGIGSAGSNAGIEASVGSFVDGLYMPTNAMNFGELIDIQSVEILRGPQGTLYGRNTPVGALNITTRNPSDEFESMIKLGYGEFDRATIRGYVGSGLSESTAGRLSFSYRERDGYQKNTLTGDDINDTEEWSVRGKLLFAPYDSLEVTTILYYGEIDRNCCVAEQMYVNDPTWGIATPGFLAAQAAAGYPFTNFDDDDHRLAADAAEGHDSTESFATSVQVDWTLDNGVILSSITGYQDWRNEVDITADSLPNPVLTSFQVQDNEVFSQEFRITSPVSDTFNYIAGLYYYSQDTDFSSDGEIGPGATRVFPLPPPVCPPPCRAQPGDRIGTTFEQETESLAVYGNVTWQLSDDWDVTAGARWSRDEKDVFIDHFNAPGNSAPTDRVLFRPNRVGDLDRSESKTTWSINTRYNITDDVMLFLTSSTGFKSGGFNSRRLVPGAAVEFDAEESITFEGGIKSFLYDRKVMLNATVFHMTLEDFQASTRIPNTTGFVVGNAGEQEVKGVEVDATWAPNDRLLFNASLAYLDAEFTEYDNAPCNAGQAPTNANGTCDRTGEQPEGTPEYQATIGAQWTQPLQDNLELFFRADYAWTDDFVSRNIVGPGAYIGEQDAFGLLDLRFGIGPASGRWQVEAFVQNATDEVYYNAIALQPVAGLVSGGGLAGARGFVGWYAPPRTWGVELSWRPE